jgi:hypothetical protein
MYIGSANWEPSIYCQELRADLLANLMSRSECQQIYDSPFPSGLDDGLAHLGNAWHFEPSLIEPSPTRFFEDPHETMLERYDPTISNTRSDSLWSTQAVENVQYQGDQGHLFGDTVLLQGGSSGQLGTYRTRTPDYLAASRYDEHQVSATVKVEPHRDNEPRIIKCFECWQIFESLQSLDQHTKTESHKGWRCSEEGCGKTYPRRDTLVRHQLKHSPKGHACDECAKSKKRKFFVRKDHLNEHIRKRHLPSTDDMRCVKTVESRICPNERADTTTTVIPSPKSTRRCKSSSSPWRPCLEKVIHS